MIRCRRTGGKLLALREMRAGGKLLAACMSTLCVEITERLCFRQGFYAMSYQHFVLRLVKSSTEAILSLEEVISWPAWPLRQV